jgi:hypothetical protein
LQVSCHGLLAVLKGIFDTEVVNLEMHELKWAECPKNKRQEIAAELADG